MKHRASELREMIRRSSVQPVRVRTDDGKVYTIRHPDLALVAEGMSALVLARGPGIDLGDLSFTICDFDRIQVEVLKRKTQAAA